MRKGFTLIELLISVAVIMILSAIVLPQLHHARIKSRDTKRITDITSLSVAIERYFDRHGKYPDVEGATYAVSGDMNCYTSASKTSFQDSGLADLVEEGLISSLPQDPLNKVGSNSCYLYRNNYKCTGPLGSSESTGYVLLFKPEDYDGFGEDKKGGQHSTQDWHHNDSWLCVSP